MTDAELFELVSSRLYTAVLSDALDELGFRDQAMDARLRPVWPDARFCGRARPVLCMDVYHVSAEPYKLEIEAVDSLRPGDVPVFGTAASTRNAPWGELLSTAAKARGARGALIDGFIRDVVKIREMGFPVFAAGMKPVDSKGRGEVVAYDTPTECGGVIVHPGDLIVADYDGVIAIPERAVADCVRIAVDKASREDDTREQLAQGVLLGDVFARFGVL